MLRTSIAIAVMVTPVSLSAAAPARPAALEALLVCQGLTEPTARLACFDRTMAPFSGAVAQGNIVVLDREAVRSARRSLFGLELPRLPFFDDDDGEEPPKELAGTAKSVREVGHGLWLVEMNDGALWQTTESKPRLLPPRAGDSIIIRRAVAGGYMLKAGTHLLRVKRLK